MIDTSSTTTMITMIAVIVDHGTAARYTETVDIISQATDHPELITTDTGIMQSNIIREARLDILDIPQVKYSRRKPL